MTASAGTFNCADMCEVWRPVWSGCRATCPGHTSRRRANSQPGHARWSTVLPRVPNTEHEDCGGRLGICGFDFEMNFVSPAQTHPFVSPAQTHPLQTGRG